MKTCRQPGPHAPSMPGALTSLHVFCHIQSFTSIPQPHTPNTHTHRLTRTADNSWKLDLTQIIITLLPSVPQSILPLLFPLLIISTNLYRFVSFSLDLPPSLPVFSPNYIRDNPVFSKATNVIWPTSESDGEKSGHMGRRAGPHRDLRVARNKHRKRSVDWKLIVKISLLLSSLSNKSHKEKPRWAGPRQSNNPHGVWVQTKPKWSC